MKIALATGGFDPVHSGHISYLKEASTLGDMLIVGLNSDEWLERKKGRAFMPWNERLCIINNLSMVDEVYTFDDDDNSARHFIQQVRAHYPDAELIFVNGGDRTADNIPEMDIIDHSLKFIFGVGGDQKRNSSSWLLKDWQAPKVERPWGYYRIVHEVSGTKVKELTIKPGQSISMQRHFKRNEFWFVTHGSCDVISTLQNGYVLPIILLKEHMKHFIPKGEWHQIRNPYEVPCKIVEIQFGEICDEFDIERK